MRRSVRPLIITRVIRIDDAYGKGTWRNCLVPHWKPAGFWQRAQRDHVRFAMQSIMTQGREC